MRTWAWVCGFWWICMCHFLILLFFLQLSSFPLDNSTFRLSDWPRNSHLLFSSAWFFSLYPSFLSSISRAASVRHTSTDGAWEKAGSEAHSLASLPLSPPLYPTTRSPLPPFFLASFRPLPSTLLSPLPSLPRCSPYPLYFHPSAPPSSHSPFFFFWFIICNMILPSPVHVS